MADQPKPIGRPPRDYSALPLPDWDGEKLRWVWPRSQLENVRRALAGEPTKPVKAAKNGDEPVSITQLAAELGVSRRHVVRRVDEARAAKAKAKKQP